jgi:hypothetical protein
LDSVAPIAETARYMRMSLLRLAALAIVAVAALPASASAALTASDVRIGAQPAFVRVVVDFTGGPVAFNEIEATDPRIADASARVDISRAGIIVAPSDRIAQGVRARLSLATANRARVQITATARFKYVRVSVLHGPERVVIDLYRTAPPSPSAEIRTGVNSCLKLTSIQRTGHTFRVRGSAKDLFEANFVIRVRDGLGRVVGRRIVTANGPWNRTVSYSGVSGRQHGTVEAVADSAKDGSLACIVQRRVMLVP